jgi:hypothetical protein
MKRKWAYLGALLPLSTAASAGAIGATGDGYDPKAGGRKKSVIDEEDGKPAGKQGDKQSEDVEAHGVRAPSGGASDDDVTGKDGIGGFDQALSAGDPKVQVSLPPADNSMYAPAEGGDAVLKNHGGAGGVTVTNITLQPSETASGEGADSSTTLPEETGYVEPDPVDEHAMLILLGGMAAGEGSGATSSGEVIFDVVDYGPYTIGYGFAVYEAQGADGAFADTFFGAYGADLVFTYKDDHSGGDTAYSSTYVLAIDFEGDLQGEQVPGLSGLHWLDLLAEGPFSLWLGGAESEPVSVTGNLGEVSFTADVQGESAADLLEISSVALHHLGSSSLLHLETESSSLKVHSEAQGVQTFVSSDGSLLEIEDQFSSVNGSVIVVA